MVTNGRKGTDVQPGRRHPPSNEVREEVNLDLPRMLDLLEERYRESHDIVGNA